MSVIVKIPAPMRRLTNGQPKVNLQAGTVGECLTQLGQEFPGLRERICEDDGSVRQFVNIFVRGEDIRFGAGLATSLKDGDDVSIVPAASGGS
jgi:molybdopterin synthase sulfur carrier subunit